MWFLMKSGVGCWEPGEWLEAMEGLICVSACFILVRVVSPGQGLINVN